MKSAVTRELARAFSRMRTAAGELQLPGVTEGTWLGRPCLRLRGKSLVGSKDGRALVILCPIEDKEMLIAAAPDAYFETAHYRGYPAVLARPSKITKRDLKVRVLRAWRLHASKRQLREHEQRDLV